MSHKDILTIIQLSGVIPGYFYARYWVKSDKDFSYFYNSWARVLLSLLGAISSWTGILVLLLLRWIDKKDWANCKPPKWL